MTADVDSNAQTMERQDPTPQAASFQLSIRGMLLLVFIVSAVIAVWVEFGSLAGSGATFLALLVAAHLFGALLGKSLQANRTDRFDFPRNASIDSTDAPHRMTRPRASKVSPHAPIGIWTFVVIGALSTASLAGGGLLWWYADQLTWLSGIVAIGATASLGGLAGFGVGSLVAICLRVCLRSEEPIEG